MNCKKNQRQAYIWRVNLNENLRCPVKAAAAKADTSISAFISELIGEKLERVA